MINYDLEQLEQLQKINRIKAENDCLICEIVVPRKFQHSPVSVVHGNGGIIEFAEMIKCLEDMASNLKHNFPETEEVLPLLRKQSKYNESYKFIKKERK